VLDWADRFLSAPGYKLHYPSRRGLVCVDNDGYQGGEEGYSVIVWNKKRKSRVARVGQRGSGRGGYNPWDIFVFFFFFLLALQQGGWKEEEGEVQQLVFLCWLSRLHHYRDGTWLEFGQLGDSVKKA